MPDDEDLLGAAVPAHTLGDLDTAEIKAVLHLFRLRGRSGATVDAERARCDEICREAQAARNERRWRDDLAALVGEHELNGESK